MSILLKCLIERQNNKLFSVFNTATWRTSRNKHAYGVDILRHMTSAEMLKEDWPISGAIQ